MIQNQAGYQNQIRRCRTSSFAAHQLKLEWIIETHAHADHISGAHYLRDKVGGKIAIGAHRSSARRVQKLFNLEPEFAINGSQFDHLFHEDEEFNIGKLKAKAL